MVLTYHQRTVLSVIILSVVLFRYCLILFNPSNNYFQRYYTVDVYKQLENLYNHSQYRMQNPTSVIADEIVYRYAAGAYLNGIDPILINSESLPLGKYILGASIALFQTDGVAIALFGLFTLVSLWFLAYIVLKNTVLSSLVVLFFSFEKLYSNQLLVTPLLDIIQLPFILCTLYFFLREYQKKRGYVVTALMLGFVIATKSIVPAVLLVITFLLFLVSEKKVREVLQLAVVSPISIIVVVLSYTRTFLNGYSLFDFLKFQKWIFQYQQSKLIHPFSVWRLLLLNQWQTWWGDQRILHAVDWQITWPILTIAPFFFLIAPIYRSIQKNYSIKLMLAWVGIYAGFLSLGVVSTRFFLPLLPVLYIIGAYVAGVFWSARKG